MSEIIFILFLILSFYILTYIKKGIPRKDLYIGWSIKIVFAFLFLMVFSHYYGNGKLYGDAATFMKDSQLLCEFGKTNPIGYLKLLVGVADKNLLIQDTHLAQTSIWAFGENGDFINDNRFIIRLNSIIHFISAGNVYIHALVLTFLSYLGLILLYLSFKQLVCNQRLFFYSLITFPSVAFWGSGITKESILLIALGLFFYGLFNLKKMHFLKMTLFLICGTFLLLFNKPYVGLVILSLSPFLIIGKYTNWHKKFLQIFPFIIVLVTVILTYTPSKINLLDKVSYKQKDLRNLGKGGVFFINDSAFCAFDYKYLNHFELAENRKIKVLTQTEGEYKLFGPNPFYPFEIPPSNLMYDVYLIQPPSTSYIDATFINYSRLKLFSSIPEVLHNTTIRPYPWDPGRNIKHFSFASNSILFCFILFVLFNRKKLSLRENFFITYLFISAISLLLIIGWTTPILGAIVRYKTAAELLLIIAFSIKLKPLKHV